MWIDCFAGEIPRCSLHRVVIRTRVVIEGDPTFPPVTFCFAIEKMVGR